MFRFQGRKFQRIPLNENSPDEDLNELQQICSEGRLKMIESLSDFDDQIADLILSDESGGFEGVSEDDIKQVGHLPLIKHWQTNLSTKIIIPLQDEETGDGWTDFAAIMLLK